MSPVRRWTIASLCLALVATMSCGFDDITAVCDELLEFEIEGYMDGVWALATVDGSPIPATGYVIQGKSDRVRAGSIEFRTRDVPLGSCERPKESTGVAIATYLLADNTGRPKSPSKVQAGSFTYKHEAGTLTLRALGRSVSGPRTGSSFTVSGEVPDFGTHTLVFRR